MGTEYLASVHLRRRGRGCFKQLAVIDLAKNCFPFNKNYAVRDLTATVQGATLNYGFSILECRIDHAWHDDVFGFIVVPAEMLIRSDEGLEYAALLSVVDLAVVEGEVIVCFWSE